jgi:hypothetical protein
VTSQRRTGIVSAPLAEATASVEEAARALGAAGEGAGRNLLG